MQLRDAPRACARSTRREVGARRAASRRSAAPRPRPRRARAPSALRERRQRERGRSRVTRPRPCAGGIVIVPARTRGIVQLAEGPAHRLEAGRGGCSCTTSGRPRPRARRGDAAQGQRLAVAVDARLDSPRGGFRRQAGARSRRRQQALDRLGDRAAARRRAARSSRSRIQGERIEAGVRELADVVSSPLVTECDVRSDDDVARVFAEVGEAFGGELDCLVHSVAFAAAEDLEGRFTDTPRDRFWMALDVSRLLARRLRARRGAADGGGAAAARS